ncbi:hypothetical protein DEU47_101400 [Bacillus sp. AG236]|nr:hypothetical protein DEU47_101400 [Bacillus sp. AG236]
MMKWNIKGAYKAPFLSYGKKEENEYEYESLYQ